MYLRLTVSIHDFADDESIQGMADRVKEALLAELEPDDESNIDVEIEEHVGGKCSECINGQH